MAFAQLAEELRREGRQEEAVAVCRAGLEHHPTLLTARVTLGRALVELDRLDEAFAILTAVLHDAPANLPSLRAIAEVHQRRGDIGQALTHYRRAMELAHAGEDPDEDGGRADNSTSGGEALEREVEALFDFDSLLAQLGEAPGADHPPSPASLASAAIDNAPVSHDERDELAIVERQLRERELRLTLEAQARQNDAEHRRRHSAVQALERWLAAIAAERRSIDSPPAEPT